MLGNLSVSFRQVIASRDTRSPLNVVPLAAIAFQPEAWDMPNSGIADSARAGVVSIDTSRTTKCPLAGDSANSDVHFGSTFTEFTTKLATVLPLAGSTTETPWPGALTRLPRNDVASTGDGLAEGVLLAVAAAAVATVGAVVLCGAPEQLLSNSGRSAAAPMRVVFNESPFKMRVIEKGYSSGHLKDQSCLVPPTA